HRHRLAVRPGTQTRAGHRRQMLDDGGAEHLEEEVLVRPFFEPGAMSLALDLRAGADGDDHDALRISLHEHAPKAIAGERHAVDVNRPRADRQPLRLARVHPRPTMRGVPGASPLREL